MVIKRETYFYYLHKFSVNLKLLFKKYSTNKKWLVEKISITDDILRAFVNLSSGKHLNEYSTIF